MNINNSNVAFQGKFIDTPLIKVGETAIKKKNNIFLNTIFNKDTLDYATKNINPFMYGWMLMGVVIGTRYFQARDKDEKREILTRDVIGLSGYLFAMPILMKGIASLVEKKTGFLTFFKKNVNDIKDNAPETNKSKGLLNSIKGYVLQAKGYKLLSYDKIKQTYLVDSINNNDKMSDFAELIIKNTSEERDNLKKILSFAFKNDKDVKIPNKDNAGIKTWLLELEADPQNELLKKIKGKFTKDGVVHKQADLLKSVPDLLALVSIISLLGWFLPWFNIHYTRALYKSGKNNPNATQSTQQPKPVQQVPQVTKTNLTSSQSNIFAEFVK